MGIQLDTSQLDSFNPCYDGLVFSTAFKDSDSITITCFNPCYDGLVFSTNKCFYFGRRPRNVSILVMMD